MLDDYPPLMLFPSPRRASAFEINTRKLYSPQSPIPSVSSTYCNSGCNSACSRNDCSEYTVCFFGFVVFWVLFFGFVKNNNNIGLSLV